MITEFIHYKDEIEEYDARQIRSVCGRYIYHVSIIDYLQKYDLNKKLERLYKCSVLALKGEHRDTFNMISCVEPKKYKDRLYQSLSKQVFTKIK